MFINLDTRGICNRLGLESSELPFEFHASPNISKMVMVFFESKSIPEIVVGMLVGIFLLINYLAFFLGSISMIYHKKYIYFMMILVIIMYFST